MEVIKFLVRMSKLMNEEQQELQRGLKNRHVQLISIGGAIGTGLFLCSGKSIQ